MNKNKIFWVAYIILLLSINVLYFIEENENKYNYEDVIGLVTIFYFVFGVIVYSFKYDVGLKIIWKISTISAITWNLYSFINHLIVANERYHWAGIVILVIVFILVLGPATYATLRYSYSEKHV